MMQKYHTLKINIYKTKGIVANNIKSKRLVDKSAIARFINNADLGKKK